MEANVTSETAIEGEAEYDEKRWEARLLEFFVGEVRSLAIWYRRASVMWTSRGPSSRDVCRQRVNGQMKGYYDGKGAGRRK